MVWPAMGARPQLAGGSQTAPTRTCLALYSVRSPASPPGPTQGSIAAAADLLTGPGCRRKRLLAFFGEARWVGVLGAWHGRCPGQSSACLLPHASPNPAFSERAALPRLALYDTAARERQGPLLPSNRAAV